MSFYGKGKLLMFAYVQVMGHKVSVRDCFYSFRSCLKHCRTSFFQLIPWLEMYYHTVVWNLPGANLISLSGLPSPIQLALGKVTNLDPCSSHLFSSGTWRIRQSVRWYHGLSSPCFLSSIYLWLFSKKKKVEKCVLSYRVLACNKIYPDL